ncbi:MAG: hypothetical protein KDK89_16505 [Alphaproteobacteria bacterium]|nr:hypothetical protein [Alphaproteobacteria bacterium]
MRQISNNQLKSQFIGWQCRIRQMSARDYGGQPMAAMHPRVSSKKGDVILPAMMILLVPEDTTPSTAFLRFQLQKTSEHQRARDASVKYLAADFYQLPELFSDEMTAVFGPGSETAARLMKLKEVLLDFDQFSQSCRMFCKVRKLGQSEDAREFSLWHTRVFNPNVSNEALVLGFKPDWKSAVGSGL